MSSQGADRGQILLASRVGTKSCPSFSRPGAELLGTACGSRRTHQTDVAGCLDVGRHTFAQQNRVDPVSRVVRLVLVGTRNWRSVGMTVAVAVAETFWLLPALDHRVGVEQ